jgi:hypothetical protein
VIREHRGIGFIRQLRRRRSVTSCRSRPSSAPWPCP